MAPAAESPGLLGTVAAGAGAVGVFGCGLGM